MDKAPILEAIARQTPFSFEKVNEVFEIIKSYDVTIIIISISITTSVDPVELSNIYLKRKRGS
jgi:hypothetical protein